MNKHRNVKTTIDGITFDSKKEAGRWCQLKILERAGLIKDLQRQVPFELIPKQPGERACKYVADFTYTDCKTGEYVAEDTKGQRTKEYIIKRKLMLLVHNIKIKEV